MDVNGDEELSARAVYRNELLRQRERSGWTLAELAERTKYDASYLQRLETGGRLGSVDAAGVLDRTYGTGDLLAHLWRLAKREAGANRYEGFSDVEAEATGIHAFSLSTVPGLLQTPGYAEALLRLEGQVSDEILTGQVRARMARQERLAGPKALQYRGLLDESVIRRPTSDPQVWADQLARLVEAAQEPNISLQIVPFGIGPHALVFNTVQLLWLPSGRTVAYFENIWSGQLVQEIEDVERIRLAYDLLRDSALSTRDSLALMRTTLEDHTSCEIPHQI
ncbi:helix-turn-helix domain-containing protein [Actinacidiphila bryophytorum]|uniref:Helix-turn-helix domain-containing protein n=1 Tax=Actinacidiphila bryophytorum TaxID=1436133 RepID=A0A9W4H109_9ACTN|nr:helix-turn-helix transcriptional regulator [Actinacidiphila bryophytorum]MBM9439947.1 helix-turn-helix domain-containing protein [Actinacidiphila bryophytorum]MBN6546678.1 helix-turn-helix domain-containing protein [Actinacidiphila bryophytorum]CAG7640475.1 Helix-turn-helix domain-containing protein [Actinacidiphila bryophytorum]